MPIGNPVTLTNNVASKTLTIIATASQTNFTIPGGYRIGQISVFRNGLKLTPNAYQATDGTTIVLSTPANGGDTLEFQIFDDFKVANALDVNTGGTVGGTLRAGEIVVGTGVTLTSSGLNVTGVITATTLSGNINSTGISTLGNVRITSGIVTAASGVVTYYGDGTYLNIAGNPSAGVSSTTSVTTAGIITATIIDGFVPGDDKIINVNTTVSNGRDNYSLAEDLIVGAGVTLTVSTGTTVTVNPFSNVAGQIRYNSSFGTLEFYDGVVWYPISLGAYLPNTSEVGVFGGGSTPTLTDTIDYITIASTGNATTFGTLTVARNTLAACSSSTRGVFGGGLVPTLVNTVDYVTIAAIGDAISFGSLTAARGALAACSSSTRGVFGGGATPTLTNTIDYITIASTGNTTDFGDLTVARSQLAACSSSARGVFGGGTTIGNTIDYITIASTGNAIDFGDLTVARSYLAACSSSTRGVFGGGLITPAQNNTIDYITIASTGNAIDFGDLTVARSALAACSSSTRGVFGGGNTIDYITIASTGNAIDFGDLTVVRDYLAACSNSHGGLG